MRRHQHSFGLTAVTIGVKAGLMEWNISKIYRVVAWFSAGLWTISLACPAYVTAIESDWSRLDYTHGYEILLIGWLGILEGIGAPRCEPALFGWLANIALLWNFLLMRRGAAPNSLVAFAGLAIAIVALQPIYPESFGDDHGVNSEAMPQFGAYIWAASLVPITLVSAYILGRSVTITISKAKAAISRLRLRPRQDEQSN
ncbi:MAG: hypothetical protein JSR60_11080 [Proteobacteria bacterium]|nr:hypothetical protein [Pseudomonadota bacterium]